MYFIYDNVTNGYNYNMLNILSILSIITGILVITSKNPIVSVLFLIALFFDIACFLITLGLNYIGLSYLLIYVGAISILFLFILMLINIRVSELLSKTRNSIPLVLIVSILISLIISNSMYNNHNISITSKSINLDFTDVIIFTNNILDIMYSKLFLDNINYVTSYVWDGNIIEFNPINTMGSIMFTSYPIWLIITSLILLLAMSGVIIITLDPKNSNNS